ncbi:MAG TPA: DUF4157 domain-containing protein [Pseudonocardiaceae bacterium]
MFARANRRRPAPSAVTDVLRSPGEPLNAETARRMGARFDHDFSRVRVHADPAAAAAAESIGARAYTAGEHVVLGGGQHQPEVLAHELAHVVQQGPLASIPTTIGARGERAERDATSGRPTEGGDAVIRRYESPEHKAIGDEGFAELADFLKTPEGTAWLAEHHLDPGLANDFANDQNGAIQVGTNALTVGDVNAFGDFYGSAQELLTAPPEEVHELLDAIKAERAGELGHGEANRRYEEITRKYRAGTGRKTYIGLADDNGPHFTPTDREAWLTQHQHALDIARNAAHAKDASKPALFDRAVLFDSFAAHFLTDAFATGHLFELKKLVDAQPGQQSANLWQPLEVEIISYLRAHPPNPANPELRGYYLLADGLGKLDKLVLKNIHDRLNAEGMTAHNKQGMTWKSVGDDHLRQSPEAMRVASLAMGVSRRQLLAVLHNPTARPDPREVLDLLPDDQTVRLATQRAIGYIPAAVREVSRLLYAQAPALNAGMTSTLGIPGPGAVIESNVRTVASPYREKQLEDLRREQDDRGQPLIAPSLTITSF